MEEFVHALGSYGVAPFSALLTATLLYWLMVILGAMDLDILHFGHGHDAGHHGGDHAEAHAPGGLFHGLLEFLSIGKVPITITLSILVVIGWGVAMALTLLLHLWWPLVLATALLVGIPLTGFATRPLRVLFTALSGGVATGVSLIGREARITSATCDADFGTATCDIEGAEVLLRVVAIRAPPIFHRDEVVVIADHDPERDVYLVAPAGYRQQSDPLLLSESAPRPPPPPQVPQALTLPVPQPSPPIPAARPPVSQ